VGIISLLTNFHRSYTTAVHSQVCKEPYHQPVGGPQNGEGHRNLLRPPFSSFPWIKHHKATGRPDFPRLGRLQTGQPDFPWLGQIQTLFSDPTAATPQLDSSHLNRIIAFTISCTDFQSFRRAHQLALHPTPTYEKEPPTRTSSGGSAAKMPKDLLHSTLRPILVNLGPV
jgi:hypothetical protein